LGSNLSLGSAADETEPLKRSPQAIRSWRAGPLVWRPAVRRRATGAGRGTANPFGARGAGRAAVNPFGAAAAWLTATRRRRIALLATLAAVLLLGGAWLWFRDSPLVAVQKVTVTGENGPDAGAIRSALVASARSMTTLDVQTDRLYAAVSAYPVVRSLRVSTQFPHGMRIRVLEELPVAQVVVGGRRIAVASDGTLLRDLASVPALPEIQLAAPPGGPRLMAEGALEELRAARTAPRPLFPRIALISEERGQGLVVRLHDGPAVYLGEARGLRSKWSAAVAVLGDPGSAGATYIDVSDPARPAAGAIAPAPPKSPGTATGR
jgi:cell division protein FtsQ